MNYADIKSPKDLYIYMKNNINYGFVTKNGEVFVRKEVGDDKLYEDMLVKSYYLQSPEELDISGYGLCFDQVIFARNWLKNNGYNTQGYYTTHHNHTFLAYKDKDITRYVLFERTLGDYNGLKNFYGLNSLLNYYNDLQKIMSNKNIGDIDIYSFGDIEYGLGFYELLDELRSGEKVLIK